MYPNGYTVRLTLVRPGCDLNAPVKISKKDEVAEWFLEAELIVDRA